MASVNTKKNKDTEENHLYNTPKDAMVAANNAGLFDNFDFYYDPCSGIGNISEFLYDIGKSCQTSDLIDYGYQQEIKNFLEITPEDIHPEVECIIFNPPFKLTEEFIDHALSLCPNLIMFNRATVFETQSRSRKHKDGTWKLREVYSFANRVSCTEGVAEKPTANSVWYSWSVYDQNYKGKPTLDWLFTK